MRLAILLAGLAAAGCGGDGRPARYPASGKVTVNGQPAAGALVVFHPKAADRANDPKPFATAADDGTFKLTTHDPDDGAPAGEYGVTVVWNVKAKESKISIGDGGGPLVDKLGGRYGDPRGPKLSATVTAGGPNQFDFDLK
jgi:hypothetical protein